MNPTRRIAQSLVVHLVVGVSVGVQLFAYALVCLWQVVAADTWTLEPQAI